MPKPTYDNSIIFSITHAFLVDEASEQANIESQFGNGLYAPLFYSNFVGLDMDWKTNINSAGTGIQGFKNRMDKMIAYAESNGVGIHLTVTCGLARNVHYTEDAKQEDVRNAQWYNDNNMSSSSQAADLSESGTHSIMDKSAEIKARKQASSSVVNKYVFGTFSRYARKLRGHMEAKLEAALEYARQQQAAHPGVTIIFSAPGESELNYWRINEGQYMQDSFCDYSPFAIAEFRDWVKHEGLYATGERYASQGY
ncbi:MAG: hypothetical protein GY757_32620, partial [bacterium]|nr:hypothetical protein [bacterium]